MQPIGSWTSSVAAIYSVLIGVLLSGCSVTAPPTPTPTKTPTPVPTATATTSPTAAGVEVSLPTPAPTAQAPPTATSLPTVAPTRAAVAEPPPAATEPMPTATDLPAASADIAPPLRGGDWDMEDGFYVWPSPYENFGGFVANGWAPLVIAYEPDADPPNAPRLNENKNPNYVHSGGHAQEVSFDYRVGEAGIYRVVSVTPGHRYQIEAWARYTPTGSGLRLALGIDLSGGEDVTSSAVQWYPWRNDAPDRWLATQEIVTATGQRLSIFLRAVHPAAVQGGNTMFDNVSFVDLGP